MFDLILDKVDRPYRKSTRGTTAVSLVGHVILITGVFVVPLLYATDSLPEVPDMMAFVALSAEAPPPPPPPPVLEADEGKMYGPMSVTIAVTCWRIPWW